MIVEINNFRPEATLFAYVLFFSIILMAVSGLSPAVKNRPKMVPLESYANMVMAAFVAWTMYGWPLL
jgi:hypothetical protein